MNKRKPSREQIEAQRLQAAINTVLAQEWGPESPTARVVCDAVLLAWKRQ